MEFLKKLTGKNPAEYEQAAKQLVNTPDVTLFKELVTRDDYIFPFIKQNVAKRILEACSETNYQNLYQFLPYYSPYYEDVIVSVLAKFDSHNAGQKMIEYLKSGTEDEKCYAAAYLIRNPDSAAGEYLREHIFSDNEYLAANSVMALKKLDDSKAFNIGIEKLNSADDYEVYAGVKFLASWGDSSYIDKLYDILHHTSIPEYIALEINALEPLIDGLSTKRAEDAALALCHIISGLSELISLDTIFELNFFDILKKLAVSNESYAAVVLMMAKQLFGDISANDEYLFDLDKNTKDEVYMINDILSNVQIKKLESGILEEAYEDSPFISFVIDFIKDAEVLKSLMEGANQTVILKALERLKVLGLLDEASKSAGLAHITNENIKAVAAAL